MGIKKRIAAFTLAGGLAGFLSVDADKDKPGEMIGKVAGVAAAAAVVGAATGVVSKGHRRMVPPPPPEEIEAADQEAKRKQWHLWQDKSKARSGPKDGDKSRGP